MTAFGPAASWQLRPFDAARAPSADLHRALVAEGPVVPVDGPLGETAYVVTDPAAARALLTDPRFVKNSGFAPRSWLGKEISLEPAYEEQRCITTADGPAHLLLRRMQARLLSPAVVRDQQPRIEGIARTLLAEIDARCRQENRRADPMREFCYRFPPHGHRWHPRRPKQRPGRPHGGQHAKRARLGRGPVAELTAIQDDHRARPRPRRQEFRLRGRRDARVRGTRIVRCGTA